jgi:uncharacterized protein (TIGR02996 family)
MTRAKRKVPDPLPVEPWLRQFPGVEGFLRAIAEEPWDDAHRLILADWLDERGAAERAEVIRVQCRLAPLPSWAQPACLRERLDDLVRRGWVTWRPERGEYLGLTRGLFTEVVDWDSEYSNDHLTRLATVIDVQGLTIEDSDFAGHQGFFREPGLRRLTSLSLKRAAGGLTLVQELAACEHFAGLDQLRLHLEGGDLGDEGVLLLTQARHWRYLTALDLRDGQLTPRAAALLAAAPLADTLARLDLSGNPILDAGVASLATSPGLARLRSLDLANAKIANAGTHALAASPHLHDLAVLNLEQNEITEAGVRSLTGSNVCSNLSVLRLGHNRLTQAALRSLASASRLGNLERLDLRYNPLKDGAALLLESAHLARLTALGVSQCGLRPAAVEALAACPGLSRLRELDLSRNLVGPAAVALARSPHLANLTHLNLADAHIEGPGLIALAESPHLANLTSLNLAGNLLTAAAAQALRAAPHLTRLTRLALDIDKKAHATLFQNLKDRWPFLQTRW